MQLIKEIKIDDYKEQTITLVHMYYYENETERNDHIALSTQMGWQCDGKIKENIGTIEELVYVYCGNFMLMRDMV